MRMSQNYIFLLMYFFHSTEVQNIDILHHSLATDTKKGNTFKC